MTEAIATDNPTVAELLKLKPAPESGFTIEEQIEALAYVLRLIDECLGHSAHDSYRAYARGADVLGFKFDGHRSLFRDARLYGPEAAVRMHPNLIRPGEMVGWTYFAADSGGKLIKIGHSSNPRRRLATLESTTGKTLTELHRIKGFFLNELVWHIRARAGWLGGEWFDLPILLKLPLFDFLRGDR